MKKFPKYKYVYAFVDFLILMSSFFFTSEFIGDYIEISEKYFYFFRIDVFLYYFLSSLIFIYIFKYYNLYKNNVFLTKYFHFIQIIKSFLTGIVILVVFTFIFKLPFVPEFSRKFVSVFSLIAVLGFVVIRIYILRIVNIKILNRTLFKRNVAIIGCGNSAKLIAEKLIFENTIGIELVGFIDNEIEVNEIVFNDLKNLGKIDDLKNIIADNKISELLIAIDNIEYGSLLKLIDECSKLNIVVKISSPLFNIIPQKIFLEEYSNIPVVNVSHVFDKERAMVYKRIFDFVVASILVILLLPLYLFITLAVRLSSKGPVIFSQTRIGKDGKPFKFHKFRSMNYETERDIERENMMVEFIKNSGTSESSSKIINEKRVTGIGKLLRKTSLDELPQLYNVLKGEMSLVGPRPSLPYEYEHYEEWQKIRHSVLPGCTGVWQVSGRKNVSFRDSVILDLYYVKNMSPWLDIQILIKTIPAMLFFKGEK